MKNLFFLVLFFELSTSSFAQNFFIQAVGTTDKETKTLDSLKFKTIHLNQKSVNLELNLISEKLSKLGYVENTITENYKLKDSVLFVKFNLGLKVEYVHLRLNHKPQKLSNIIINDNLEEAEYSFLKKILKFNIVSDTLVLPYHKIKDYLEESIKILEQNGYPFAKLKLDNLSQKEKVLFADLLFQSGNQSKLDEIVVQFEENSAPFFPKSHLIQLNKKFRNAILNEELVEKIRTDFNKLSFINQIKPPEILFKKNTAKVFVYPEKRKSNNFDGFIGFANTSENKLIFNGYLDLNLKNAIKTGEELALFWKSDGNNQRTLKASIDLPYVFKSPIGLKAQLFIFKQDSIFQNTKTTIDVGYLFDYNKRLYLGYLATESSDIQNANTSSIGDFTNSFLTTTLKYNRLENRNSIFSEKTNLNFEMGFGQRTTKNQVQSSRKSNQAYLNLSIMHNFYLNSKNCININYHNFLLKSDDYLINELHRFGGTRSIRGFIENSFQANFLTAIMTEYRYIASPELYFHTVLDYAYYEDKSAIESGRLLGIGAGVGLATKNGILRLNFVNGNNDGQKSGFSETILSMNYSIQF